MIKIENDVNILTFKVIVSNQHKERYQRVQYCHSTKDVLQIREPFVDMNIFSCVFVIAFIIAIASFTFFATLEYIIDNFLYPFKVSF